MKRNRNKDIAIKYAQGVVDGDIVAADGVIDACNRFLTDLKRKDIEYREAQPDAAIAIMENLIVHRQGEDANGKPLMGEPFILEPWQKFLICNILGFWYKGTQERRYKEAFIMIARKNGKALSLDTDIPTPGGWKKMSEIHEGDYVFGDNGRPVKVIYESPVFLDKPMYEVTFEDGAKVKASTDHIWRVQTKRSRRTGRRPIQRVTKHMRLDWRATDGWYDTTTGEMATDFVHVRPDGKGVEYKYRVPMQEPIEYAYKELPIDPYVLGVWLGDGTRTKSEVTCSDADTPEMVRLLEECGCNCRVMKYADRAGQIVIDSGVYGKKGTNHFKNTLRALGLYGNKHIPEAYLQASIAQRMDLLQGLMDTDGYCSKAGQCEFVQKDRRIVYQVKELLSSLGIKSTVRSKHAKCNGVDAGIVYSCMFFTDLPVFRLERKKARLKKSLSGRMGAKSIVNIEPIMNEPSKCIAVDNENSLYLCGRDYTVTHNTSLVAGLALALSIIQRKSGSRVYVVAAALKQALESFEFLKFTINYKKLKDFDIHDNNMEHSIKYTFEKEGRPDGFIDIQILASNPDAQDSFNCNFAIADEVAAYKKPAQYNRFKEAMKAYTNKLMVGITTAGDNVNSFGYQQMEYALKVASGVVKDDDLFSFVARADMDDKGNVDFTNPIQHQKANPNYGVSIRPKDILQEAMQAKNNPQQRKDFLSRSLNIYTASMKSWFDLDEFRSSDGRYTWTLKELSKLPIDWYGGADLSRMYDLTAAALYGRYDGVDIIITHAFTPVTQLANKQDEDGIPVYEWIDNDWLTTCNSPTIDAADVVNWFVKMRNMGFKIRQVGHDRKFAGEEYFPLMKQAHFSVVDQPQLYYLKSQGFRHIEKAAKDGKLYYMHSNAYEYCIANVKATEGVDDAVMYEKVMPNMKIDLFDASVFACIRMLKDTEKKKKASQWFGGD